MCEAAFLYPEKAKDSWLNGVSMGMKEVVIGEWCHHMLHH